MNSKTNITACPSIADYEKFLNQQLNTEELTYFNHHIENCQLCKEALDGYSQQKITNIESLLDKSNKQFLIPKPSRKLHSYFQIAASIVILIGLGISIQFILSGKNFLNKNDNYISVANYTQYDTIAPNGSKKLSKKSSDQYLYLGEKNNVLLNDQLVSLNDINNHTTIEAHANKIIIQVETSDYQKSSAIISQIKEKHQIPVLTIRNLR